MKRRQERSEQKIIPFFFHSRLSLSFHSFFVRLSLAVDSGFSLPPPLLLEPCLKIDGEMQSHLGLVIAAVWPFFLSV